MSNICGYDMEVVSVEPESHEIVFRVFNVRFRWAQLAPGERVRMVSRWKPGSEGRSQSGLHVPKHIWNKMCEMAAGIAGEQFRWPTEGAPPEGGSEDLGIFEGMLFPKEDGEQFELPFEEGAKARARKVTCSRRSGKAMSAPVPQKHLIGCPTHDSKLPCVYWNHRS